MANADDTLLDSNPCSTGQAPTFLKRADGRWFATLIGAATILLSLANYSTSQQPTAPPPVFQNGTGWNPDKGPKEAAVFAAKQPPHLAKQVQSLVDEATDRDALNYRFVAKLCGQKILTTKNQSELGSCVGFGSAAAVETVAAADILHRRQREVWHYRVSGGGLYALSRTIPGQNDGSEGSTGAWAMDALQKAGVLFEEKYGDGEFDLTKYDISIVRRWQTRGIPKLLIEAASKHPVRGCLLLKTTDQLKAGLQNGYAASLCAAWSFVSKRDSMGFARSDGQRKWNHCFIPGVVVHGAWKRIEDLEPGDIVVNSQGVMTETSTGANRREYMGIVQNVDLTGLPGLQVTADHPFLVYRSMGKQDYAKPGLDLLVYSNGKYSYARSRKEVYESGQPAWLPANELTKGDYLLYPAKLYRPPHSTPSWDGEKLRAIQPNDSEYLLGYYVANGHLLPEHGFALTIPLHKRDALEKIVVCIRNLGKEPSVTEEDNCYRVKLYCRETRCIASWCGKNAENKQVPEFLYTQGWDLKLFLKGYTDGDGCDISGGQKTVSTVSSKLAHQIWSLCASFGYYPKMLLQTDRSNAYANAKPLWYVTFAPDGIKNAGTRYWNGYYCLPIRQNTPSEYNGPVYAMEVPDGDSYVAGGVVSHNCMAATAYRGPPSGKEGFLIQNSWQKEWIGGPTWPDDQPEGSFWATPKEIQDALSQGDSWLIGDVSGFKKRELTWGEALAIGGK